MIIGEFTTGVRILLEKGLSRCNTSEDKKFQENIQKFIYRQKTPGARRRAGGGPQGPHTIPRRGAALGRAWAWCGHPGPPLRVPLRVFHPPKNLRLGERPETYSAAAAKRKTPEREKLSGREKSAGEIPSRRGEPSQSSLSSSWTSS